MKFSISKKLTILLGIISTLAINSVQAEDDPFFKDTPEEVKDGSEQFYLVIAKNHIGGNKSHDKRGEKGDFLNALVNEINNLIIGNKDTYEDTTELKKLEEGYNTSALRRRSGKDDEDEEENKYAYVISSLEKESMILTYLSEDLVPLVKDLPNVKAVVPDSVVEETSSEFDELDRLKRTAAWQSPCVKGNTYSYLSLLSQDKFDDSKKNASYDSNYYYPSSAGKDVNIFIIDSGFNFRNPEFSNTDERTVQCLVTVDRYNQYHEEFNDFCMHGHTKYHGSQVADMAAGLTNGVASKANIYGIGKRGTELYRSTIIKSLEYIRNHYFDLSNPDYEKKYKNKSVINMSITVRAKLQDGENYSNQEESDDMNYMYQLIGDMTRKGAIFVVAAGNDNVSADKNYYPCAFNNVICVGAIDNIGINEEYEKVQKIDDKKPTYYRSYEEWTKATNYTDIDQWKKDFQEQKDIYDKTYVELMESKQVKTKNYRKAYFSNYGEYVNIYAPGFINAIYQDNDGNDLTVQNWGTSFASPIVAGVVATYLSEFPYYNYDTKKMLKKLQNIGIKNAIKGIPKGESNLFINNGKKVTYSHTDKYNSCGTSRKLCSKTDELQCFEQGCCLKA